jgi:hypothetical protein
VTHIKAIVLLLCVNLLPLVAFATPQTNSDVNPRPDQEQPLVLRSIEGCLSYNGVSYVLAVVSNGPKQYRVVGGDTELLRGKVGHTVEITGMAGKNNPQAMIMNWDMREATTGVGWYTITAETVHDVTSNCSYPGFERPESRVAPE